MKETEASTWSSRGVLNFFLQSLSLANLKGLGHLYMVTAAGLRAEPLDGKGAPAGVEAPLGIVSYLKVSALIKAALSLIRRRRSEPMVPRVVLKSRK